MPSHTPQPLWVITNALFLIFLREETFFFYQQSCSNPFEISIHLGIYCALFGPLSFLIYSNKAGLKITGYIIALSFVVASNLSNHYEAFLGEAPGPSALYFLQEIRPLLGSILDPLLLFHFLISSCVALALLLLSKSINGRLHIPFGILQRHLGVLSLSLSCFALYGLGAFLFLIKNPSAEVRAPVFFQQTIAFAKISAQRDTGELIKPDELSYYRQHLGQPTEPEQYRSKYKLCRERPAIETGAFKPFKNIIMIILESIDSATLHSTYEQEPLMPFLKEVHSDSLTFSNFFAAGQRSSAALSAIFSGLPEQLDRNLLWEVPLRNMDSFPRALKNKEFRSAYFHGGDLSFEQQDQYLKKVGFDDIHGLELSEQTSAGSWGKLDGEVFASMQEWLSRHQQNNAQQPFLSVIATMSTHHPFERPKDWKAKKVPKNYHENFQESARYLDVELRRFFTWFKASPLHEDTLVVILGDHPRRPYLQTTQQKHSRLLPNIPLVLYGFSAEDREQMATYTKRPGSQYDLPATLSALVGVAPNPCHQGANLLAPNSNFPAKRLLFYAENDERTQINYFYDGKHFIYDTLSGKSRLQTTYDPDAAMKASGQQQLDFGKMTTLLFRLSADLTQTNTYAPPNDNEAQPQALPSPLKRIVIDTEATSLSADILSQNSGSYLPLYVSTDKEIYRIPNLLFGGHSPNLDLTDLSLAEITSKHTTSDIRSFDDALQASVKSEIILIESFTSSNFHRTRDQISHIAQAISNKGQSKKFILMSQAITMAAKAKELCACQSAWFIPNEMGSIDKVIEAARENHIDWVFTDIEEASTINSLKLRQNGIRFGVIIYKPHSDELTIPPIPADLFVIRDRET